jgi:hypothetical protein
MEMGEGEGNGAARGQWETMGSKGLRLMTSLNLMRYPRDEDFDCSLLDYGIVYFTVIYFFI